MQERECESRLLIWQRRMEEDFSLDLTNAVPDSTEGLYTTGFSYLQYDLIHSPISFLSSILVFLVHSIHSRVYNSMYTGSVLMKEIIRLSSILWILCVCTVDGAIFEVINTSDGDTGSLRWAIGQANGTAGDDTIAFNIPGPGPHVIQPASGPLVIASPTDGVVIDGYTQPGSQPATADTPAILKIRLDGSLAAGFGDGMVIWASGCVIRGLAINNFDENGLILFGNASGGGGHIIEGNHIGTDVSGMSRSGNGLGIFVGGASNNTIGGTSPSSRNVISGNDSSGVEIRGDEATGNLLVGNYVGVNAAGTDTLPNGSHGIHIWGCPGNTVGGDSPDERNIISGNWEAGVQIFGDSTSAGNIVQGNYIGTDPGGNAAFGNGIAGVTVWSAHDNTIGGSEQGEGNVIVDNFMGVWISDATDTHVEGNWIGTTSSNLDSLGNGWYGVWIDGGINNTIGGLSALAGNIIAWNDSCGVVIDSTAYQNAILRNAIHSNGGLGIDLGGDGITLNDPLDVDSGGNQFQNFPVLTSVSGGAGGIIVEGTLNSATNTSYSIAFYNGPERDPTGYGEGWSYFGFADVVTDETGHAEFTVELLLAASEGIFISSTATDPDGNTSEFSPAVYYMTMLLNGARTGSDIQLQWTNAPAAGEYWIHGMEGNPFFIPDSGNRLAIVQQGTQSWIATGTAVDPETQWTFQIVAMDEYGLELVLSNRFGEIDYEAENIRRGIDE